jgi:hypothetical protein
MANNLPNNKTASNLGLVIFSGGSTNPTVIGAVSGFEPNQSRQGTHVYEFGTVTNTDQALGMPYEVVVGNVTGLECTVVRTDLYNAKFEKAWSADDLIVLANQLSELAIKEVWNAPNSSNTEMNNYIGCWFTTLGRRHSASTPDRIVTVNARFMYRNKVRLN